MRHRICPAMCPAECVLLRIQAFGGCFERNPTTSRKLAYGAAILRLSSQNGACSALRDTGPVSSLRLALEDSPFSTSGCNRTLATRENKWLWVKNSVTLKWVALAKMETWTKTCGPLVVEF